MEIESVENFAKDTTVHVDFSIGNQQSMAKVMSQ